VLQTIRSRGYAVSFGERHTGAAGIGAPVFDGDGKLVAAVGLTGPSSRIDDDCVRRCSPLVVNAAQRISFSLGYRGGHLSR
jgi:DNA-binding IclR family transcriptional regulator